MRDQALHRQLLAYRPHRADERAHRDRMLELLQGDGDPFSAASFAPGHFTASAFVLDPASQQVLLILHGKLNRWLQPGGHIDPEDVDPVAAARREVGEEAGLTHLRPVAALSGLFDIDVHEIPARRGDPAHHHFDLRFAFQAADRDAAAASDAKDVRWVDLDAVCELESVDSVQRAIEKLRTVLEHAPR